MGPSTGVAAPIPGPGGSETHHVPEFVRDQDDLQCCDEESGSNQGPTLVDFTRACSAPHLPPAA